MYNLIGWSVIVVILSMPDTKFFRAEFGLITPSAVIVKGDTVPDMTQISETKVTWGKERSHVYRRETIRLVLHASYI